MDYDVIIIGGSFAGLSSAMSLGRALRKVLIIDSGEPCNRFSPASHNFITHDGTPPREILSKAKEQVLNYKTVEFLSDRGDYVSKKDTGFEITTAAGKRFTARKLILTTGIKDVMPEIEGFEECWGISILHCPYCHGYEVRDLPTGLLIDDPDMGFEMAKFISNWTKTLTLFTNGKSALSREQTALLESHNIKINENKVSKIDHNEGYISNMIFENGSKESLNALYARPDFQHRTRMPESLGCTFAEAGFIETDAFQRTSVAGVYAAGDCTTSFRFLGSAISAGGIAGAFCNKDLIEEAFK